MYTAVKWGGMKEIRYWIPQHDLERKEESWKMAHRLHIQGYEDKKKWVEQQMKDYMHTAALWVCVYLTMTKVLITEVETS